MQVSRDAAAGTRSLRRATSMPAAALPSGAPRITWDDDDDDDDDGSTVMAVDTHLSRRTTTPLSSARGGATSASYVTPPHQHHPMHPSTATSPPFYPPQHAAAPPYAMANDDDDIHDHDTDTNSIIASAGPASTTGSAMTSPMYPHQHRASPTPHSTQSSVGHLFNHSGELTGGGNAPHRGRAPLPLAPQPLHDRPVDLRALAGSGLGSSLFNDPGAVTPVSAVGSAAAASATSEQRLLSWATFDTPRPIDDAASVVLRDMEASPDDATQLRLLQCFRRHCSAAVLYPARCRRCPHCRLCCHHAAVGEPACGAAHEQLAGAEHGAEVRRRQWCAIEAGPAYVAASTVTVGEAAASALRRLFDVRGAAGRGSLPPLASHRRRCSLSTLHAIMAYGTDGAAFTPAVAVALLRRLQLAVQRAAWCGAADVDADDFVFTVVDAGGELRIACSTATAAECDVTPPLDGFLGAAAALLPVSADDAVRCFGTALFVTAEDSPSPSFDEDDMLLQSAHHAVPWAGPEQRAEWHWWVAAATAAEATGVVDAALRWLLDVAVPLRVITDGQLG
jgi:hypothetical protein